MLGPDRGAKAGGGKPTATPLGANSKTRARQKALKKYRRRLREVYEHEPRELRIAVNGFVLAQQEITAAVHKQTLGIEVAEELTLIEVLSEQGVRLLALNVAAPPTGQFEQHARVEFSEGRTLATHLNFCVLAAPRRRKDTKVAIISQTAWSTSASGNQWKRRGKWRSPQPSRTAEY
jgi:hypothetical protein